MDIARARHSELLDQISSGQMAHHDVGEQSVSVELDDSSIGVTTATAAESPSS